MLLSDARTRLVALPTKPEVPGAVTPEEANAGVRLENRILKNDFRLSPTASDTVPDTLLSSEGNATTFGASNYEGSVTPVRFMDGTTGAADPENDVAFDTFRAKGTELWLLKSIGRHFTDEFEADDEYDLFHIITDNPQDPTDMAGYIKKVVPLGVQTAWLDLKIAASGV